jgi:hypothetical protein
MGDPNSYPQNDEYLPGTWKVLNIGESNSATFVCPECCRLGTLIAHQIADDGTVSPSVECECGFHEWIKLEGWES